MIPSLLFLAGVIVGLSIYRITKLEKAPAQSSQIDPEVVIAAGITIGLILLAANCASNQKKKESFPVLILDESDS